MPDSKNTEVVQRVDRRRARQSRGGVVSGPTDHSRRNFLVKTLATLGVLGLAGKETFDIEQAGERKVAEIKHNIDEFLASSRKVSEAGQETLETREATDVDIVFGKLSSEEGFVATKKIKTGEQLIVNNLGSLETVKRISSFENLVRKSAQENDVPENLLLGMVIVESNGDALAESRAGARGLTQMMEAMAMKYSLKTGGSSDERFNPDKIVSATAKELAEAYQRFGNWGLAVWEWHAGAPKVYEAIQAYLRDAHKEYLPSINDGTAFPAAATQDEINAASTRAVELKKLYRDKIAEKSVNVHSLFQNSKVKDMFSGAAWDKTDEYVYRIVAAARVYKEVAYQQIPVKTA